MHACSWPVCGTALSSARQYITQQHALPLPEMCIYAHLLACMHAYTVRASIVLIHPSETPPIPAQVSGRKCVKPADRATFLLILIPPVL